MAPILHALVLFAYQAMLVGTIALTIRSAYHSLRLYAKLSNMPLANKSSWTSTFFPTAPSKVPDHDAASQFTPREVSLGDVMHDLLHADISIRRTSALRL